MHPNVNNDSKGTSKKETFLSGFLIPCKHRDTINIKSIINYIQKVNDLSFILGQKANLNMEKKVSFLGSYKNS